MIFRTQMIQRSACRRVLAMLLTLYGSAAIAQNAGPTVPIDSPKTSNNDAATPSQPWIVRDPATGRLFQQQLVPFSVPVTRWEARTIEQTVYEPNITSRVLQIPQTTYTPNTQYVMQPKVRGGWNPFRPPVQAYQYVPITNWVLQTQQIQQAVPVQQWVPKQQKIVVYQQLQTTEIRQQLVQTELPQPQTPQAIANVPTPRQPLFRLSVPAQQRVLPYTVPSTSPYANNGLRPVASPRSPLVFPPLALPRIATSPYAAPLQTTTSLNATASRDFFQSGMQPTVLR